MKSISRTLVLLSLSLGLGAEAADPPLIVAQSLPGRLPGTLPGQQPQQPPTPQKPAPPLPTAKAEIPAACCDVTEIDKAKSVVKARERAGGRVVEFKVADAALLQRLRVGQDVHANFTSRQVSVDGKTMCCTIVSVAAAPAVASKTPAQSLPPAQKAPQAQPLPKVASTDPPKTLGAPLALPGKRLPAQPPAGAPAPPTTAKAPLPSSAPAATGAPLRGSSPASENEDGQPDPAPRPARSIAAKGKTFNRGTAKHVKDLQDVQKFFASLGHEVEKLSINVALVGGNKYMVNDCLGIKASAGQFTFRPGAPSLRLDGSGVLMQFAVNRVSLDGLSVRVRPNASNPTKLCHFSKRFGVGGSASNVRFEIRFDPLLDLRECRVDYSIRVRSSFAIGGFNLRPLQNDLDRVAKNMIEDAINLYIDSPSYEDLWVQAIARALKTTCTGGI